jgi:hypothetical protein
VNITLTDTESAGDNVRAATVTEGGKSYLVLLIDMSKDLGPSASGKMRGIASTGGFASIANGVKLNLYVGKKA